MYDAMIATHTKITGQAVERIDTPRPPCWCRGRSAEACDVAHRLVLRAGVVLGDPHQRGRQLPGTAQAPNRASGCRSVDRVVGDQPVAVDEGDEQAGLPPPPGPCRAPASRGDHTRRGLDEETQPMIDAMIDTPPSAWPSSTALTGAAVTISAPSSPCADQRHGVGLEQVGRHAGAVACCRPRCRRRGGLRGSSSGMPPRPCRPGRRRRRRPW